MFFAIILIAIGVAILLSSLGIISGDFWGIFWAIIIIAAGIRLLMKKGKCTWCDLGVWHGHNHDHK